MLLLDVVVQVAREEKHHCEVPHHYVDATHMRPEDEVEKLAQVLSRDLGYEDEHVAELQAHAGEDRVDQVPEVVDLLLELNLAQ